MADVNEIEWPSFESVLRELSPERVEAREMRKLDTVQLDAEDASTEIEEALAEEAIVRDIPDSTVDDIAAVLITEISGASVENEAEPFVGEDPLSDDAINQLLGNEEFMGHLVDLDNPAPEDLTVSPEEAAQASFIDVAADEPEIEYTRELGVETLDVEPTPDPAAEPEPPSEPERASLVSLFNNADTKLYTESDPEWVWAQFTQESPPPVADAPASEIDIDLVDTTDEAELVEALDIDLTESEEFVAAEPAATPARLEDPWAHMRPSDDEDVTEKKIVFWADRPKFFGGDARHEARARRLYDND